MITRYAPAPTGYLHLGHVLNAIYVWGVARALGGRVLLRIEDHDRQRSRQEFERALVEDLDWLGFAADAPLVRQSDRSAIYESALARLRAAGLVYACACSRAEIQAAQESGTERRYSGTCADKGWPEGAGRGVRVRIAPGVERFDDLRHGPQEQDPSAQCGDLLLRDRDGNGTYQFAAAVDDFDQGITHVIRGDDLLASTGRQIRVARLLGRPSPAVFLHHPLIMKRAKQKLSKSDGDTGVRDLRRRGLAPADVIGRAAALGGLVACEAPLAASDVQGLVLQRRSGQGPMHNRQDSGECI